MNMITNIELLYNMRIDEYNELRGCGFIAGSITSSPILGEKAKGGCSRTVQGHSSLQFSTPIDGSAG
jgi:hypothetical protein